MTYLDFLPLATKANKRMYCCVCKAQYPFFVDKLTCCGQRLVKINIMNEKT